MQRLLLNSALSGILLLSGVCQAAPPKPQTTPPTTAQVEHLLRRFAFSAAPAEVAAVQAEGIAAWLATQEQPNTIDDTGSELEQVPTALNADGSYPDYNVFERIVYQHMILSKRELQAKMELQWLDHFAVGLQSVGDPAIMYHYDQTVRADALGNFGQLLADVSLEPAMLYWLSNNGNSGSKPNENFAREVMQLYSIGLYKLNKDGSQVISGGLPVPNYSQEDVEQVARAVTGYSVVVNQTDLNPETRFSVTYTPSNHYAGGLHFLGAHQNVPAKNGLAIAYVANVLAHQPSTGPFIVTELLQRFVTETPSPQFISDIVAVWNANVDAPDQIAQVITAIVNHPDFQAAYHQLPKQPVEMVFGALREMPGMLQASSTASPGGSLLYELNSLGQQLFYPPTVFSFYRPGNVETTVNTGAILTRTGVFANITNVQPSWQYVDTYLDIPTLRTLIGSTDATKIATYLCNALIDGGTTAQVDLIRNYLGATPDNNQIQGAIWILLNTPDFGVN